MIIQKMSTAQAPKLFTVQLEDWSQHYPYISCFQALGLYSSVTLGFLEFQRPSSVHLFLRCAYLPCYYKAALDLKISMQGIYTYTHKKKEHWDSSSLKYKKLEASRAHLETHGPDSHCSPFLGLLPPSIHNFTSHGTRINCRALLIHKKCWQMGTIKNNHHLHCC